MPQPDPTEIEAAIGLYSGGRLAEAEGAFRAILSRHPLEPNCAHMLGMLLYQRGELPAAEPLLKASMKFADRVPEWHSNYALFCCKAGRLEEALRHLRRTVELRPGSAEAQDNLAIVLDDLKRYDEADAAFGSLIAAQPGYFQASLHWAKSLCNRGKLEAAVPRWRRVLELHPNHAEAHAGLYTTLSRLGRATEALPHGETAVSLEPANPEAHLSLANALGYMGSLDAAMARVAQALTLKPGDLNALSNMGWLLERWGRHEQAAGYSREVLRIDPDNVQSLINLATSLHNMGDYREAIACLRRVLSIQPDHAAAHSNLLLILLSDPELNRRQLFEEHRQFEATQTAKLAGRRFTHENNRDPDRPLRIGYVSPDFRHHPIASFLEPILRSHDRQSFIVTCYSSVRTADEVTQWMRDCASHWYNACEWSDEDLARKIHANREDILVDLTGHTAGGRLLAFAMKPAPVQITYLGYLTTTGLSTMDYRLTDSIADPPGESESFHTERLLRLPCFFCYQPPQNAPAIAPAPHASTGRITFGSLNHPVKYNLRVLEIWAQLLRQVPGSRLMLSVNDTGPGATRLHNALTRFGIAPGRIILAMRRPYADYLALYNSIDIALDPFPSNGHTTTCEALWMGVPVVTLRGQSYLGRLSAAVLTPLGLEQYIARDPEHYIQIAANLAADPGALADLRASLRVRMIGSTITNAAEFTGNLEEAYRKVWRDWCKRA